MDPLEAPDSLESQFGSFSSGSEPDQEPDGQDIPEQGMELTESSGEEKSSAGGMGALRGAR